MAARISRWIPRCAQNDNYGGYSIFENSLRTEHPFHRGAAVVEDLPQLAAHPEGVDEIAERAEGQGVGDPVGHEHAAVTRLETVFVIPEPVGADALLVHETDAGVHVADFGEPVYPAGRQDPDAVGNELAGMHRRGRAKDAEFHFRRSERVEVVRSREEVPNAGGISGYELLAFKGVDHAGGVEPS